MSKKLKKIEALQEKLKKEHEKESKKIKKNPTLKTAIENEVKKQVEKHKKELEEKTIDELLGVEEFEVELEDEDDSDKSLEEFFKEEGDED